LAPLERAVEVDERMKAHLLRRRHEELILRQGSGVSASLAIPSNEHYLPMLYAIALQELDEKISFTFEGFQNGTISLRSFRIG
jgi:4,5-DOPA dioxygenase extradiol